MRVGWGLDAHRFGGPGPILLCGVVVATDRGLEATSDGDVAAHAVADALLGGAALGDLGAHFPSADPHWEGADSMEMLRTVVKLVASAGLAVNSVDLTVIAEDVRVGPHREEIRNALATAVGVEPAGTSVKATSTDGMGFIGAGEGMAAVAVATLRPAG